MHPQAWVRAVIGCSGAVPAGQAPACCKGGRLTPAAPLVKKPSHSGQKGRVGSSTPVALKTATSAPLPVSDVTCTGPKARSEHLGLQKLSHRTSMADDDGPQGDAANVEGAHAADTSTEGCSAAVGPAAAAAPGRAPGRLKPLLGLSRPPLSTPISACAAATCSATCAYPRARSAAITWLASTRMEETALPPPAGTPSTAVWCADSAAAAPSPVCFAEAMSRASAASMHANSVPTADSASSAPVAAEAPGGSARPAAIATCGIGSAYLCEAAKIVLTGKTDGRFSTTAAFVSAAASSEPSAWDSTFAAAVRCAADPSPLHAVCTPLKVGGRSREDVDLTGRPRPLLASGTVATKSGPSAVDATRCRDGRASTCGRRPPARAFSPAGCSRCLALENASDSAVLTRSSMSIVRRSSLRARGLGGTTGRTPC